MSKKKDSESGAWVNDYLSEVGSYSSEHMGYIDKMSELLNSMKSSGKSNDNKIYFSFKDTVDSFNRYVEENRVELTPHENKKMTGILLSNLENPVKKRMTEDLIHKIKDRFHEDLKNKKNEEKKSREISELKTPALGIVKWIRLTKFSLAHGTITLFSHNIKASSLNNIKVKAFRWFHPIEKELSTILDDYCHFLSIMEYNSISKFNELGIAFDKMSSIRSMASYEPGDVFEEISEFSNIYLAVIKNRHYIERALKKIYRDRKPKHGFWGYVGSLLDKPVKNNKLVSFDESEEIIGTILGTLKSYYTSFYRTPVKTLNQVMYIVGTDGKIADDVKNYSLKAKEKVEKEESQIENTQGVDENRLKELVDLTGKFKMQGEDLAERFFRLRASSNITSWRRESEKRPFFKLIKVVEAYSRYLIDLILDSENLSVEYDDKIQTDFFSRFPELINAARVFQKFLSEMEGSKTKELLGFIVPENHDPEEFINDLMMNEVPTSITKPAQAMKSILNDLSSHSYNLVLRLNDIINSYCIYGKGKNENMYSSYDFYLNGSLLHSRMNSTAMAINTKEMIFSQFVEAACSVALYISGRLRHYGIEAIETEVVKIQKDLGDSSDSSPGRADSSEASNEDLMEAVHEIYNDTLTGLKKIQYIEDVVLPKYYDENGCLSSLEERHLFCLTIVNLAVINERYGNDCGDRLFVEISEIIKNELHKSNNEDDFAFRHDGGMIYGFINAVLLPEAVDTLRNILNTINKERDFKAMEIPEDPIINFGIIKERLQEDYKQSMKLSKKVMLSCYDGTRSRIAFPKNSSQVLEISTLDKGRVVCSKIISIIDS